MRLALPHQEEQEETGGLQQYEIVRVVGRQYSLATHPEGFALEILDFLGPGDRDFRGRATVWVRGPVVSSDHRRGTTLTVQLPHDQPRARRTGGAVMPPFVPSMFERVRIHPAEDPEGYL
jgi:hypothetical protein